MTIDAGACPPAAQTAMSGAAPLPRVNVLGVGVVPTTLSCAVDTLESWVAAGRRDYVCCISVHGVVTSQRDPAVREALNRCGLATAAGMPLVWWSRRAGFGGAGRVCGPDLMDALCARSASQGHTHYFYGGNPAVIQQLIARLGERHPGLRVAGYRSPPYRPLTQEEDEADIAAINAARPDFVWVGLGMPKQEKWMASHVGRIEAAVLLGVGAAFDFHAGIKPRAPVWMQRTGVEWIFRLASEPRRLARRYLIDNTVFVTHAVRQLAGWKSYAQDW